ncbi:hypothetical protein, partial [Listeria sp. SHR_NRA_18]|uniref:hypothetical protein n=1 Tax=Listeria sp. SHR_NRA_18 TaxID=2269046 RepID=UPI001F357603
FFKFGCEGARRSFCHCKLHPLLLYSIYYKDPYLIVQFSITYPKKAHDAFQEPQQSWIWK